MFPCDPKRKGKVVTYTINEQQQLIYDLHNWWANKMSFLSRFIEKMATSMNKITPRSYAGKEFFTNGSSKTNIASRGQNPAWVSYPNLCKISSIALSMWNFNEIWKWETHVFAESYTPKNFTHDTPPPQKKSFKSLSLFIPGFIPMASFWSV